MACRARNCAVDMGWEELVWVRLGWGLGGVTLSWVGVDLFMGFGSGLG